MPSFHGASDRTGEAQPLGSFAPVGKFGRMFPTLKPFAPPVARLVELGNAMVDPNTENAEGDNPSVPSGFTYLGQFVDHDITFDSTALQGAIVDPLALVNFRTPALDLDSVYGQGPSGQPYIYDRGAVETLPDGRLNFKAPNKFLLGITDEVGDIPALPNDLPRSPIGLALTGDPRNDENLIVAQTHVALLKFHNKVVDGLASGKIPRLSPIRKSPFEEARDIVIWHYQWIVLNDFLRRVINPEPLEKVLRNGRQFYKFTGEPFIPVEFSAAAYRLGHSMIRANYNYNRVFPDASLGLLFAFTAKSGDTLHVPSNWVIDWRRFYEVDIAIKPQASRKLDPFLADPLKNLPKVSQKELPNSPTKTDALAVRNLIRGRSLGLPTGQSVANFMRLTPLTPAQVATGSDGAVAKTLGFDLETPLWYYILKEAQVQEQGKRLGQVGSLILAEVFVGLLEGDSSSFLARNRNWKPTLPARSTGNFKMADLIRFMGDISPIDGIKG